MKIKKEYIVLALLIVLLSLYLVFHKTNRTHFKLPELKDVAQKSITKIEITKKDQTVTLNQKDDKWYISPKEYLADQNKVEKMLDALDDLTVTSLVSDSKTYERYDLGNDKKIHVKAWAGADLVREFDVGKTAQTYNHTLIKLSKDPNIYQARGDFKNDFEKKADGLRDLNVMKFNREDIDSIDIVKDKAESTISRQEIKVAQTTEKKDDNQKQPDKKDEKNTPPELQKKLVWKDKANNELDSHKIDSLLMAFSNMRCEKFLADNVKPKDYKDPLMKITLKKSLPEAESKDYTLTIWDKKNKDDVYYPAFSSERKYMFDLLQNQVQNIKSHIDNLLKKSDKK